MPSKGEFKENEGPPQHDEPPTDWARISGTKA